MIQVASVTAVYGVSFLIVLVSSLLALVALLPTAAARRAAAAAIVAVLGGTWAYGRWAMAQPIPVSGHVTVGLVQGGIRQEDKWVPENAWQNVGRHLQLTEQAAAQGARLVVWPESAVPFLFEEDPALASMLRELVWRRGVYLFFGNDDRESVAGKDRIYVGAKLLAPDGQLVSRYRKMQLVPFGEYVPLQPLFTFGGRFTAKLVQEVSDFTPGTEASTGIVDGHAIGGVHLLRGHLPRARSSASRRPEPSCWSTSRTTRGTGRRRRRTSTSRWRRSARSRTAATWCGRRTPGSRRWSTRAGASSRRRASSTPPSSCTTYPSRPG